jgi:hypothetical protein
MFIFFTYIIPIQLSGMNERRSDSTVFHNIPYLNQILVAVHEFLLAGGRAGWQTGAGGMT